MRPSDDLLKERGVPGVVIEKQSSSKSRYEEHWPVGKKEIERRHREKEKSRTRERMDEREMKAWKQSMHYNVLT